MIRSLKKNDAVVTIGGIIGSVVSVSEDGAEVTLKPGGVLFIPAGKIHSAKNVGSRKGAELATYVVEKGKPLLTEVGDRPLR